MAKIVKYIVYITQFALLMLVPIFLCFFGGLYIDKILGTSFISIIMFFVGALAGGTAVYRTIKKNHKD